MSANERGLGRGLDALFRNVTPAERPSSAKADSAEVPAPSVPKSTTTLPIAALTPCKGQPRKHFDEAALDELAASIRSQGVIQPLLVRPRRTETATIYEIVAGERRWRAAQRADLETLPAYIREVDDENLHAMALVENIQRQDLNAIEIALGMQRLIDECGLTQDALSEKVGKKRSTVSNFLRLLKLPDEIQLALKEGLISAGHAKAIAGAPADRQLHLLKRCIKKDLSVRQIEELVRSFNAQRPAEPAEDEEYPESYLRLVEQLERFFSQEISIKRSKNGGGKIVIDFAGDADIEKFLTRFADK